MPSNPKLIDKLFTRLPEVGRIILEAARRSAENSGVRLFLVGGSVRDLLLDRESIDVDLAVEGDAIVLARDLVAVTNSKLAKTTEFGTATVRAGSFVLDLASTRAEVYARPGALPRVRRSTLNDDLLRRDFTINAVALELAGPAPGKLYDPVGGVADLHAGQVRVLHERSFRDDATRIIRGIRYAVRFEFRLEEGTHDLLLRDLPYLDSISGTRVRQEIDRTFKEDGPAAAVEQMRALGILQAVHPALASKKSHTAAIKRWMPNAACWALLAFDAPRGEVDSLVRRCSLTKKQAEAVRALPHLRALSARLNQPLRPSEVDELLSSIPEAALIAYASAGEAREPVREYLAALRHVRPTLRGDDVIALGVAQGPEVAEVLQLIRAARLDGVIATRQDEEAFIRDYIASRKRAAVV